MPGIGWLSQKSNMLGHCCGVTARHAERLARAILSGQILDDRSTMGLHDMAAKHFHLITEWDLDAPVERVWPLLKSVEAWPSWWLEQVVRLEFRKDPRPLPSPVPQDPRNGDLCVVIEN